MGRRISGYALAAVMAVMIAGCDWLPFGPLNPAPEPSAQPTDAVQPSPPPPPTPTIMIPPPID